jgi:2OG-Fe(II) oxygenase superfamily
MFSLASKSDELAAAGEQQHETYRSNVPFSHIVLDDFVDPTTLRAVLAEVDAVDRNARYAKFVDRKTDHNKFAFKPEAVGPQTTQLVNFLNSGPFIGYLEKLTGIDGLLADPSYFGGGVHWIENGGFLEIHADFNHLKKYNLERRINLLLYLNTEWDDSYNGHLELWDRATMSKAKAVAPLFDRCVIFSTTKESLHGHPVPLSDGWSRFFRQISSAVKWIRLPSV